MQDAGTIYVQNIGYNLPGRQNIHCTTVRNGGGPLNCNAGATPSFNTVSGEITTIVLQAFRSIQGYGLIARTFL